MHICMHMPLPVSLNHGIMGSLRGTELASRWPVPGRKKGEQMAGKTKTPAAKVREVALPLAKAVREKMRVPRKVFSRLTGFSERRWPTGRAADESPSPACGELRRWPGSRNGWLRLSMLGRFPNGSKNPIRPLATSNRWRLSSAAKSIACGA